MTTGFKNGTLSVFLKGEIDHHRAASIREEIDGAVRAYLPENSFLISAVLHFATAAELLL